MRMISRGILGLSFLLTVAVGFVLFSNLAPLFIEEGEEPASQEVLQTPAHGFGTDSLNKLSMFPHMEQERPIIAVVIENHEHARVHQRGLKEALMVQEHMVEGLISRFVALYDARSLPSQIGPVRSLRSYFLDAFYPWATVVLHAGGSPGALDRVDNDPNIDAYNGLYMPDQFIRDEKVAPPHDLFVSRKNALETVERIGVASWPPYNVESIEAGKEVHDIKLVFFSQLHNVQYTYHPWSGTYKRVNGNVVSDAHPRNVLILEAPIEGEGEFGRLRINLNAGGQLLLFRNGTVISGRWIKDGGEFVFIDSVGHSLKIATGQTWMTILPTLDRVKY